MTKLTPALAKHIGYKKQRDRAHRGRLARVARTAVLLRELKRPPTRADLAAIAEEIGVNERTVYRYLEKDMSTLDICRCCGRPYAEDKIIAALEAAGVIPRLKE